jgi:hypothetical protein
MHFKVNLRWHRGILISSGLSRYGECANYVGGSVRRLSEKNGDERRSKFWEGATGVVCLVNCNI